MIDPEKNSYKFLFKPIFFILAITAATFVVLYVEKVRPSDLGEVGGLFLKDHEIIKTHEYKLKPPAGKLTEEEIIFAKIAWKYFENNFDVETGFINGKDNCTEFTFQDLTSYLMGMLSAFEIGIIDSLSLHHRISLLMLSLEKLDLYDQSLPNRQYHILTLQMLDSKGVPTMKGIGWDALHIGRFFAFVNKIKIDFPQYFPMLRKVLKRWRMDEMVKNGSLEGMVYQSNKDTFKLTQAGRLGFEEYVSKSLFKAGYDATEAMLYTDFLKFIDIYGHKIAVDSRESRDRYSHNHVLSDPYFMDGIEYGWDVNSKELAWRIFKVQKERFIRTGILTATGADFTDDTNHPFVYNSIYSDFNIWVCYDEKGKKKQHLKMISTKTAFAYYVLYDDDYTQKLFEAVKDLYDPQRGWYAGRYEKSGMPNKVISAITNGLVLEAMNYRMNGTLIKI
jgi:hypothetical protein